jgi:hypothetical protein
MRAMRNFANLVRDETIPKWTEVAPGATFRKTWCVRNDSPIPWALGTGLVCVDPGMMQGPDFVPATSLLQPGHEGFISVDLTAPTEPGKHVSKWQICAPGLTGRRLKVKVRVPGEAGEPMDEACDTMLAQLEEMGFTERERNARLLQRKKGDLNKVLKKLTKKPPQKA